MDEPLTPISPEIREQIDAIRSDAAHPYNNPMHRDHEAAQAKMESLYGASTNEPAIADEAATLAAPPAPPPRLDLPPAPEGRSYDAPTVTEFVDMVASQGIDEATVNQWIVKGHERLAQGGALPPAAADAVLRERFGERLPAVTADAQYWFDNSFRGETREKVAAWLDETGMARGVQLRYVAAARWLCKRCLKEWHRLIATLDELAS